MEGGAHSYRIKNFIIMASRKRFLAFDSSEDDTQPTTFTFKANENFAKFLVISSKEDKPITSLSPFIIEKQIESLIGTPKNVKKLKNGTLLVETNRKSQTDNLLKITKFFNINVSVTEHKTLNSCKGIIRDRMLKHETEENITEYLNTQGVTACKRFKIKKDGNFIETNTLLLTFNTTTLPKSLKIFYRIIPVEVYIPNPLRCFNCQRFGHHENGCPKAPGSVCEKCGMGEFDHPTNACKNEAKCVNCHKNHQSKSNQCEIWKKEKEIMKIKVTQKITYLEAKKIQENQPEITFAKVVQSLNTKPETKESSTQFNEKDSVIKANSKVITPTVKPKPKPTSTHQSRPPTKSQNSSQTQPTKTSGSQQRSRSRTADQKEKNGKEKDKDKAPNPYSKGASADPIKLVNRFDSLENMELETDSSMFLQSQRKQKD